MGKDFISPCFAIDTLFLSADSFVLMNIKDKKAELKFCVLYSFVSEERLRYQATVLTLLS